MKANNGYVQLKQITEGGVEVPGNNLRVGEVISIGDVPTIEWNKWPFKKGAKVLFDTNKSLKHGEYWYLKAESIFAYDENK